MPLSKQQSKLLRQLRSPHGRRKTERILCEGVRCCAEALRSEQFSLEFAVCTSAFHAAHEAGNVSLKLLKDRPLIVVDDREFAARATTESPQGLLCVLAPPMVPDKPEAAALEPFVLILDRVSEPGNVGTILRTAWAIGLKEVWYTEGTADPLAPKTIRAGMGAQFSLVLRRYPNLPSVAMELGRLGAAGMWCAMPRDGISCFDDDFDLCRSGLVIGNEVEGIRDYHLGRAVSIPMPGGAESLNVAQAATVLLVDTVRRGLAQPNRLNPDGNTC